MKKGKFIVFEGGEGSGKDTQIELLKKILPSDTVYAREPGSTKAGEKVRELLLDKSSVLSPKAELLLFSAAREMLMKEIVIPSVDAGKTFVLNRFYPSTFAYQIHGRKQFELLGFLREITDSIIGEYKPDLYILLDVHPKIGLKRAGKHKKADRFEMETLAFHERVREGYLSVMQSLKKQFSNTVVINAEDSIKEVHDEVVSALKFHKII